MIPEFVKGKLILPKGIHLATISEFEHRFVYNFKRKVLYEGLLRLIEDLQSIGSPAIYVDGSYVTKMSLPNDIDVCWELIPGEDYLRYAMNKLPILFDHDPPRYAQKKAYNADVFPANLVERSSGLLFLELFQKEKYTNLPKGIVKIEI